MKRRKGTGITVFSILALVGLVAGFLIMGGCGLTEAINNFGKTGNGDLIVSVPTSQGEFDIATIQPSLDMDITHYVITGSGISETLGPVVITKPDTTASFTRLETGPWTIYVSARNLADVEIGYGSNAVGVIASQTTQCDVTVTPLTGTGTLHIDVGWFPPELIASPALESTKAPVFNILASEDLTSAHSINTDNIEYTGIWDAGWYLYTLILKDGVNDLWGFADAVRIVKDQTSEYLKALTEDDINGIVGGIDVEIFEDMENAIHLTFTGVLPQIEEGDSMSVSCTYDSDDPDGKLWFVNGREQISDRGNSSIVVGAVLPLGIYRLDHVVSLSGERRMGGKGYIFEVVEEQPDFTSADWIVPDEAGTTVVSSATTFSVNVYDENTDPMPDGSTVWIISPSAFAPRPNFPYNYQGVDYTGFPLPMEVISGVASLAIDACDGTWGVGDPNQYTVGTADIADPNGTFVGIQGSGAVDWSPF